MNQQVLQNQLNSIICSEPGKRSMLGNVSTATAAWILATLSNQSKALQMVVVPDTQTADQIEQALYFFAPSDSLYLLRFPDWETLPYDRFSPHQDIISDRLTVLHHLSSCKKGILIVTVATLMHRICPQQYVSQSAFLLKQGDSFNINVQRTRLEKVGYNCVSQVSEHGEFSVRGSLVDVFPMGSNQPFRIDLFDDEIESIHYFDINTQRSLDKVTEIQLLPGKEFPLDDEGCQLFRSLWREKFQGDPRQSEVYTAVSEGETVAGIEYYLPLFFEEIASLFEYLPEKTRITTLGDCEKAATSFWQQCAERYDQYAHDIKHPILPPKDIYLPVEELFHQCKRFARLQLHAQSLTEQNGAINLFFDKLPESIHKLQTSLKPLEDFVLKFSGRMLFCVESPGRLEILQSMLAKYNIIGEVVSDWARFLDSEMPVALVVSPLEQGFIFNSALAVITEHELFGRKARQQNTRRSKSSIVSPDLQIRNLAELTPGSPVVHLAYGVGRYQGLTHLDIGNTAGEFVTITYADNDKLYVPVASLHLVSRYSGADLANAPLHALGSDKWHREKQKAAKQIRDVAAELLDVYAKRAMKKRQSLTVNDELYQQFVDLFPFEETNDQIQAVSCVMQDLASAKAMDRVICGDVGFGKTEVAMRAAFLAVQNNKQVAMLVPTTLLAQQHYQTFVDRFANFPVKISALSRFRSNKENDATLSQLAAGCCDIVIGTHKLLQKEINFKNLGLLILDEEHRFGVRQKEKLKALRAEVDILTLTATPIPRTLNMSLAGIRDLSIIATPPKKRLAVKTFVRPFSKPLIREAIQREMSRGGQVYYLHNEVDTIEQAANLVEELLPEAKIAVAHGQMPERQLEQVMSEFYHRRYDVLVCSTIIETGIDVPSANTIIMNRADKLGLAQLHQLRGRVGRSHHQAYAFCLTPTTQKITSDAKKRLEALEALDTLGAGFALATHDLEIRGAGELLGEEQSGNMQTIGYSLYMELLDRTVKALQKGERFDLDLDLSQQCEIDLQLPALIPEDYLADVKMRLILYKRIASAETQDDLHELQLEMQDRFGIPPEPIKNLFQITAMKLLCEKIGIVSVKFGVKGGAIQFKQQPNINPQQIIQLIQQQPQVFHFAGPTKLKISQDMADATVRLEFLQNLLKSFKLS